MAKRELSADAFPSKEIEVHVDRLVPNPNAIAQGKSQMLDFIKERYIGEKVTEEMIAEIAQSAGVPIDGEVAEEKETPQTPPTPRVESRAEESDDMEDDEMASRWHCTNGT